MKAFVAYLKALCADPLFLRVCVVLWGLPFAALSAFAAINWRPSEPLEWFGLTLLGLIGGYGLFLIYAGLFGSPASFDRAIGLISDGGELLGLVLIIAVALIAIPITLLLRSIRDGRRG